MLRGVDRILIEFGKASRPFVNDNDVWVHIVLISRPFYLFVFVFLLGLRCLAFLRLLSSELGNKCGWTISVFAFGVGT